MKLTINVDGCSVILSAEQLETLASVLRGCEMVQAKYMGTGKGTNGSDFMNLLQPYDLRSNLVVRVMPDDDYDALKFFTASQAE